MATIFMNRASLRDSDGVIQGATLDGEVHAVTYNIGSAVSAVQGQSETQATSGMIITNRTVSVSFNSYRLATSLAFDALKSWDPYDDMTLTLYVVKPQIFADVIVTSFISFKRVAAESQGGDYASQDSAADFSYTFLAEDYDVDK